MQAALDLFLCANLLLMLAYGLWRLMQSLLARLGLQHDYRRQLALLKTVLIATALSPLLAHWASLISHNLAPHTPLTLHDLAIAAYLRGEIAMPATEFEALLATRDRVINTLLNGTTPWMLTALAAFAGGALYHIWGTTKSVIQLRQAIRSSYLWRRTARTDVLISDRVGVPFAARGLTRRYVVLPSHLLTHPDDFRMVLGHEFEHLRAGDVEWELAFEALRPLLYWNPAFALWKRAFDQLRELGCDQAVMQRRRLEASRYATCLLDYCEREIAGAAPKVLTVAFLRNMATSSRQMLEARVLAMYHRPTSGGRGGSVLLAAILVVSMGVTVAAATLRQPSDWSQDQLMLSTIINLERLHAINTGQ